MVVSTPKSVMLKLLIVTELLNANNTLSPFLKDKDDFKNSINELLGMSINLSSIKELLLSHVLRKLYSLPIGMMLKDNVSASFTKRNDEFVFSFTFEKEVNSEPFSMKAEIRFKKNNSGSVEAYKKFSYDGPSGVIFSDFASKLNTALLPTACSNLIDELFELSEEAEAA